MKKVGIIGGSGFIGSYVTKKFLENNYQVKVSATDLLKKEKFQHLYELPNAENLEVVTLDTEVREDIREFIQDCHILIHGGTPFKLESEDPQKELFEPTMTGTTNFLEAIRNCPSVEKVVFIASVAAINAAFPMPADGRDADHVYSEDDAPFVSDTHLPYSQAKHYADQSVRKYLKRYPDLETEIVSVFPTLAIGKPLSERKDSTSVNLQYMFQGEMQPSELTEMLMGANAEFALVAVQDVAEGIFRAATIKGLHGKNYLLTSKSYAISDISRMLNKKKPEGSPKVHYSNKRASHDLEMTFMAPERALNQFST